jgi:hypothetical protein
MAPSLGVVLQPLRAAALVIRIKNSRRTGTILKILFILSKSGSWAAVSQPGDGVATSP